MKRKYNFTVAVALNCCQHKYITTYKTLNTNIMKLEIKIEQGKLTVNGKTLSEMNYNEKRFLNNYIQYLKYGE